MPTDPTYWERLKAAFASLSELSPADRDARLSALAGSDAEIHAEVRALLDASESLGERFERGVAQLTGLGASAGLAGQTIAQWKIIREIGQGGMGAVYEAERVDQQYRQRVAFKTLATGRASDAMLRRFRHERQILARLEHPNIARLIDGGVTPDGQPYFVMEYVEGEPIDRWCATRHSDLPTRLRLFRQVTAAVQYAHEQLVVHRDLKPRNILVTSDGTVKLLDFGIAKLLEPTLGDDDQLTVTGALPMTPGYASPEQRRGAPVTTTSDVYSLGVVLYQLLTGRRPFEDEVPGTEVPDASALPPSRQLTEATAAEAGLSDVPRLRRTLAGDLDSIVGKALRPEPDQRYRSAQLLRDDLERYLTGAPVSAQADAVGYRARKFVRRHRAAVLAAVFAALTLLTGTVVSLSQAHAARVERDRALREAARTAQVTAFLQDVLAAARPQRQGRNVTVLQAIDSAVVRIDSAFVGDPDLRAAIKLTLGSTLNDMNLYERAQPLLLDAYQLRRAIDGEQPSKDQADALYDLANIQAQVGSAAQAESLYRVSLDLLGRLPSPDSADIYEGLSNVAEAQLNQGQIEKAAALYDTVARALDRLRPDNLETRGITRANRGTALAQLGRTVEAEVVLREAVHLFEQSRGKDAPRVAAALQPLAGTLVLNRKFAEAESVARRAVGIDEREYGPTNPQTLSALRMVTAAQVESGRCDAAAPLLSRMLALRGTELPESDPTLGTILLQRGQCELATHQLDAAEKTLRDALAVRERTLGAGHWAVSQTRSVLGEVLMRKQRPEEGRRLLAEGLDGLRTALGPDHPRTREAVARNERWSVPASQ
jgi:serine/threonine-protein kinase